MNFSDALSAVTTPLWVGGLVSFALSVLVVLTTRWHGFLSLDESAGVQKVHAHPTPRVGGLPMVLGLLAAVMVSPAELRDKLWPWLLAGSPAFAFGLAEDLTKRVGVMARLLATMGSGVLAWFITGYALSSVDLPPVNRATEMLVKSDIEGVVGHEEAIYGRADHWVFEGGRGRDPG